MISITAPFTLSVSKGERLVQVTVRQNLTRTICDVIGFNRHGGVVMGEKNLYPKGKQCLWPHWVLSELEDEKVTPGRDGPSVGWEGSHH